MNIAYMYRIYICVDFDSYANFLVQIELAM